MKLDWRHCLVLDFFGRWPALMRLLVLVAVAVFFAAVSTAAGLLSRERLFVSVAELAEQQSRLQQLQTLLESEQLLQLQNRRQQLYLQMLLSGTDQKSIEATDVTHWLAALQDSALRSGWQPVIGYNESADEVVLDLQASTEISTLPAFWLHLQRSGNLFAVRQLELKTSTRDHSLSVRMQLQPLLAGELPQTAWCERAGCEPRSPSRSFKQRGFLLRSTNNQEQLTPIASDGLGRIRLIKTSVDGVFRDD